MSKQDLFFMTTTFDIPSDPSAACDFYDAHGFFPEAGETESAFLARAAAEFAAQPDLKDCPEMTDAVPIPPAVLQEGAERTERLYGFSVVRTVPGYFLNHGFGFLWGGCTAQDDQDLPFFLLRGEFADRKRWFIYDRSEILSHEQCHVARTPLNDMEQEEFFAYQTSASPLRRYVGNCFRTRLDSFLFLGGLLPLFAMEAAVICGFVPLDFPLYPFLLFALVYPVFALIRNQLARNRFFRARRYLAALSISRPDAVLFRAVSSEIRDLSRCRSVKEAATFVEDLASRELRWKIALRRFK